MSKTIQGLLSFDKGEEISTHESGADACVTCQDGVVHVTIDGGRTSCMKEKRLLLCLPNIRMLSIARSSLKCCWL